MFKNYQPLIAGLCIALFSVGIQAQEAVDYIDPFIGTGPDGHTFPGAVTPFGMVQLSPDTQIRKGGDSYKWCAGYLYSDTTIQGFSHTHFSGTGHSDLGDLLLMPMSHAPQLEPGPVEHPEQGYRSRFSHEQESAKAGYYAVDLLDENIHAELTATDRVGMHRYTFNDADEGYVIMDLTTSIYNFDRKVLWSDIELGKDNQSLTVFRATNGWAKYRPMYFAIEFSQPIAEVKIYNEDDYHYRNRPGYRPDNTGTLINSNSKTAGSKALKAVFKFTGLKNNPLKIKVGLSAVSRVGAKANLAKETPDWDFDKVAKQARDKWAAVANQFEIEGTLSQKRQFYTALYHAYQAPNIYSDVDGRYRGLDGDNHDSDGFTNYTTFSLWDTYRALHPLLTMLEPQRTRDMIDSMLVHYQQNPDGMLPVWSFQGSETWTMIGYHSVPVIADAYLKGIKDFDTDLALKAMLDTSKHASYDGLDDYMSIGYVPMDKQGESVSKTIEMSVDDFAIARFADALDNQPVAAEYYRRAHNYKNVFDTSIGFVRGKDSEGKWESPFDPQEAKLYGSFTEGNSWQYSFAAQHDIYGTIELMGGDDKTAEKLDTLFSKPLDAEKFKEHEDIAGLIGQYAHGNEPSHHIAYLYNYTGKPWKTQQRIRQIMDTLASDKPDGLAGNDDLGQMSAWYLFSSLGFYPVTPASLSYVIGAPQLPYSAINLPNGRKWEVVAKNLSKENMYIGGIQLNGVSLKRSYLTHHEIMAGGKLEVTMQAEPNKNWATKRRDRPLVQQLHISI
ncbi:GH92 family glycosyl hydrolase [Neptunicella marina]|uniref:Glycoside hydrolase family 92 protein n=1 Tax=Neptunicella marina TaxID=2125989 RepID=A0A8J6ISV9_9ALTE|nr:GH92 family glycosyl hydrolase [Neptunicella marina]MBC3765689.1 glycoside hydrolase family 92 protein [Neptunicella marina]